MLGLAQYCRKLLSRNKMQRITFFLLLLWLLFKILKPQEMIEYEQIHFVIFSLCVLGTTLQLCSSYRYRDQQTIWVKASFLVVHNHVAEQEAGIEPTTFQQQQRLHQLYMATFLLSYPVLEQHADAVLKKCQWVQNSKNRHKKNLRKNFMVLNPILTQCSIVFFNFTLKLLLDFLFFLISPKRFFYVF